MLMFFRKHFRSKKQLVTFSKVEILHLNVFMFKKKINIKKKLKRSVMFADFSNGALIVVFFAVFQNIMEKMFVLEIFGDFF